MVPESDLEQIRNFKKILFLQQKNKYIFSRSITIQLSGFLHVTACAQMDGSPRVFSLHKVWYTQGNQAPSYLAECILSV